MCEETWVLVWVDKDGIRHRSEFNSEMGAIAYRDYQLWLCPDIVIVGIYGPPKEPTRQEIYDTFGL